MIANARDGLLGTPLYRMEPLGKLHSKAPSTIDLHHTSVQSALLRPILHVRYPINIAESDMQGNAA